MSFEEDFSNDPLHAKKKAWSGRFSEPVDAFVLRYTASVDFDKRMALADIQGSLAHAAMLQKIGVISERISKTSAAAWLRSRKKSKRASLSGNSNSKTCTSTSKPALPL